MLALMLKAVEKFWNTPPRVNNDARAGRREPQTAAEKLSHIAKRWRMDETGARIGIAYFRFLSTRRKMGVKQHLMEFFQKKFSP